MTGLLLGFFLPKKAAGNNIVLGVVTRDDVDSVAEQLLKSTATTAAAANSTAGTANTPARSTPSTPAHLSPATPSAPAQEGGAVVGPVVSNADLHNPPGQPAGTTTAPAPPTSLLSQTGAPTEPSTPAAVALPDSDDEEQAELTSATKTSKRGNAKTTAKSRVNTGVKKKLSPPSDAQRKAAQNKTGERRWKVVGSGNSLMQPLGLLDVKPDPVSHKNLNSLLLRKFDKEDHTSGWVGNGSRSNYRENVALREKHERAAHARREARGKLESKRIALKAKLAKDAKRTVPSHIVRQRKSSSKKSGSGRSRSGGAGTTQKSTRPKSSSRVSSRVDSGLHQKGHRSHRIQDAERDDDDDDDEEEADLAHAARPSAYASPYQASSMVSAPLYSTAEAALAAARAELKNVRRDRKELLNELVQLTDSYDDLVKVSEEQIEEAQRDHLQYAQQMGHELQEKAAEIRYLESRSHGGGGSPPRRTQPAPASPSRGANITGVEELRSVIVVMEEALEAQENLLRIKQQAKEEELAKQAEQHNTVLAAIVNAVAEEEESMHCTLPAVRQALNFSSTASAEGVHTRMQQEHELSDARSMIAALEDAVEAKERLLVARQAAHEEDAARWTGTTEVVVDEAEITRLRTVIANMDVEHVAKMQAALAAQQKSFNVVMSEMKMALVEAISAKTDLDRLAQTPASYATSTAHAQPTPIPAPRPATTATMASGMNDAMSLMKVQEELANVRHDLSTLRTNGAN